MKFLSDQDVFASTGQILIALGHNVTTAHQCGLSQAPDIDLLRFAQSEGRIFVTRDRDFGNLVFVQNCQPGVIYLRLLPRDEAGVHAELKRVLSLYGEIDLQQAFVVIEPGRHRIRHPHTP